jgi:hypothetical protein
VAQREVERFEGLQPTQRAQAAAHLLAQREGERLEGTSARPTGSSRRSTARTRKNQALYIDEIMAITSALRLQGSQRILTPSFVIS